jgi:ribosome-binding factor A
MMNESKRQQKFSKLLQKDLSDIIHKDKLGIFGSSFVTVASVEMTPDLSIARIHLSMFNQNKEQLLDKINQNKSQIRKELGNKIGKQVRIVPELYFYLDELEERAARIDKIIDELNIPPAREDDTEEN